MPLIWKLNLLIGNLFELILAPFAGLNPFWGLTVVSFITGALLVFIFKFVSNQEGIRRAKSRVRAHFLEVWLYKHDFKVVMGAIGRVLAANFTYMRYAVSPLLVMIVPVILLMAHLNLFYGYSPLKPGETALLTVQFTSPGSVRDTTLSASASGSFRIDGAPIRTPAKNQVLWRVQAKSAGEGMIRVTWKDGSLEKTIAAGRSRVIRLSPERASESFLTSALLAPSEDPIPVESRMVKMTVTYPEREISVLGIETNWIIIFFLLSIAAGFALKGVFGVEI